MPTIAESVSMEGQANADRLALKTLSLDQKVTFVSYRRQVLPLDGYVFWLRGGATIVSGSLHYATEQRQSEDETLSVNRVIFTTSLEAGGFNLIGPDELWIAEFGTRKAEWNRAPVRVAFGRQEAFYAAAGLFHYQGDAVYPALATQLVDSGGALRTDTLIVSNSLPAWLTLAQYNPIWLKTGNPRVPLYPSHVLPANLTPPYGAVHIEPAETRALQASPALIPTATGHTRTSLTADRVRVTLYGLTNDAALNFIYLVNQYSVDTDVIGIMNMPVVRDEKRTQVEIGALAMKKSIEFDISYHQSRIKDIAVQLITSAAASFTFN